MPKRPAKRPPHADLNQLAKSIVDQATSEEETPPESSVVTRGRKGGEKGGRSRAIKMTAEERSESARKAAAARWSKGQSDSSK